MRALFGQTTNAKIVKVADGIAAAAAERRQSVTGHSVKKVELSTAESELKKE